MKKALTTTTLALMTWVLLLIAIPTALYVSHVFDQLGEVRENNLRTLSKAAESTNQILQTAEDNVINLREKPQFVCEFVKRQPYLEWGSKEDCPDFKDVDDTALAKLKNRFATAKMHAGAEGVQVLAGTAPVSDGAEDSSVVTRDYVFNVRLDSLLAAIPFSNALDLLFIADEEGNVIHQHKPSGRLDVGLLVSSLNHLPTGAKGEFTSLDTLQRASSVSNVRLSGVDYQLLCQPLSLHLGANGSSLPGTDADDDLPQDASNATGVSGNWVLCGLVASERSLRQSLAVAPFLAFAFFAVTVFGFLTWPAIKLLWMSKRDRLYFADLCFLLFGTAGGLLLATTLILGVGSHRSLVTASEDSVEQLAEQIEHNLQQEVDSVTAALREIDSNLKEYVARHKEHGTEIKLPDIGRLYATRQSAPDHPDHADIWETLKPRKWPVDSDFEFAFWADCNGEQIFKATTLEQNTPRVNISRRQYFKSVLGNRLSGTRSHDYTPRFVQSLRSITTGKFATVISIESDVDIHESGCSGIAAAQAILISTTRPVLPPGVGFAIIDQAGTALIHSDERRALFENLYEEMDDGDRLQSIVLARSRQHLTTSYLARPHQVFVMPIERMPWSIVTFSDTELISTANLEILGHAAMVSFIFLLFYALLALFYFLWRGAEVPLWFWPGSQSVQVTRWSVGIPATALVALIIMLASFTGNVLLVAVFSLPLLIFAGTYVAYGWSFRQRRGSRRSGNVRSSQLRSNIVSMWLAWIVVAIIPAAIFFNMALESQSRVLVRYENEYLMEQMVGRNCAIDDYYKNIDTDRSYFEPCSDGHSDCGFGGRRDFSAGDLYPSSMFWLAPPQAPVEITATMIAADRFQTHGYDLSECDSAVSHPTSLWDFLANRKPIYNATVLRSRYLRPETQTGLRVNNTCRSWELGPNGLISTFTAGPLACDTVIMLESKLPFQSNVFGHPAVLTLLAMLLGALFFWTRYGARKLFFGDLEMPPLRDRQGLEERLLEKPNDSKVRLVAIAASQRDRSGLLSPADSAKFKIDRRLAKTHGQHARYDMMDYQAGASKRAELLKNLMHDIDAGKNVLIVSPVDPYSMLTTTEPSAPADGADTVSIQIDRQKGEEFFQWRQVLSKFRVVVVSINLSPPSQVWEGNWQRKLDKEVESDWLNAELSAVPELDSLYRHLERELVGSTRRNALERIVERAYGTYMAFWDACTEDEKLVLVQLAFENVVNPKQVAVVRRLIQRGLIVRDPRMRVMNQSFSRFIMQIHDPAEVQDWEVRTSKTSWANRRWVLLGILLIGMMFLWATQRELFDTGLLFLSGAAISLPGIIKLMTSLNKLGS